MSLRKAGSGKAAIKVLVYGDTGSGKSYFASTFPKILAVDSETGLVHYEKTGVDISGKNYKNLVLMDNTSDIDDLVNDLESIINKDEEVKEIETIVIDSETKFYDMLQVASMEAEERRARKKGGDIDDALVSQRGWGKIKLNTKNYQQLKLEVASRGVNVVSTAQLADLRDKKDSTKIVGEKADAHKSLPYDYDVVLRCYTQKTDNDNLEYCAEVLKDRTKVTTKGQVIKNATYDIWKDYVENDTSPNLNLNLSKDIENNIKTVGSEIEEVDRIIVEIRTYLGKMSKTSQQKFLQILAKDGLTPKEMSKSSIEALNGYLTVVKELCNN